MSTPHRFDLSAEGAATQPMVPSPGRCLEWHGEFGHPDSATSQRIADAMTDGDVCRLDEFETLVDACIRDDRDEAVAAFRSARAISSFYVAARAAGGWACGDAIATLTPLDLAGKGIDRGALHEYLRCGDISAPRTLLAPVRAVEAGHLVNRQGVSSGPTPYHRSVASDNPPDFEGAVDRLQALLETAVAKRLEHTRHPAAFLSGGIDSALLCALAVRERPDLTAVTVGFEGAAFDESPVAARIASHLGLRHEVLRFSRAQLLGAFERLATQADQPFADPAGPVTLLAFEHCRERYDAVLDGTGADAAVGALPPRHLLLAVSWASRLPPPLRRAGVRLLRRLGPLARYAPILDFEHPAELFIRWKGFPRAEIEALCGEPVSFEDTTFYRTFARFPRDAHVERYSALMACTPDDRVAQAIRISGLAVRFPFCDRDVDRYLRELRTDFRNLPAEPKQILRALLARYVPRTIWDAPKHGFNFPLEDLLRGEDGRLVREHLTAARWQRHGLLSPAGVEQCARRFLAGDSRLTFRVWALVVLGAWLEKHPNLR